MHLRGAIKADFAVSFISQRGLKIVLPQLRQVAARGRVRVLTYLLHGRNARRVVAGSSNLTVEGLTSNGELGLALAFKTNSAVARKISANCEDEWRRGKSVTDRKIHLYEKRYRAVRRRNSTRNLPTLREILGQGGGPSTFTAPPPGNKRFWREYCLYTISSQVQRAVEDETDWKKKGYHWQSITTHRMKRGDYLLHFDFVNHHAALVKIVDTTELITPDGQYFIAYRPLRGYRRRNFTKTFWAELRALGVVRNQADARSRRRSLSVQTWENLSNLFRTP